MKNTYQAGWRSRASALCLFGISLAFSQSIHANSYKHIAVPATEVHKQAIPDVKKGVLTSHSTMMSFEHIRADKRSNGQFTLPVTIDSNESLPVILLSPDIENWDVSFVSPLGKVAFSESLNKTQLPIEKIGIGNQSFLGKQWQLPEASVGEWHIQLNPKQRSFSKKSRAGTTPPKGFLLIKGDPQYQLATHLSTKFTTTENTVDLYAYLIRSTTNKRSEMAKANPLPNQLSHVQLKLTFPNGQVSHFTMNDDGQGADEIAGDGKFSVRLPTFKQGTYTTHVSAKGVRDDGIAFTRTATDLIAVEAPLYHFTKGSALAENADVNVVSISIPIANQNKRQTEIFVGAEVWGTDAQGQLKSATWIGGVTTPLAKQSHWYLPINMDKRWLTQQSLSAPFYLKNVRLQSVSSNTPLTQIDKLPLSLYLSDSDYKAAQFNKTIAKDMLMVGAPARNAFNKTDNSQAVFAAGGKLMLVHGYCSGQVWNTGNFSNSIEFRDYNQNRSHDEFARRIRDFGASYPSFGVVAHSQGGAAALTLYTRYWSGLDYAGSGRLIQSVGTPYQGTSLAGNIAALGEIFGIQCGRNTDLTYSGASNWLSTIPSWARSKVHYFTTSFKDRWWAYDYCHLGSDLLLNDPEDGTTEKWSGQLSGANNRGHKTGWCHTNGMRDPAQFKDSSRNSDMNANAAR